MARDETPAQRADIDDIHLRLDRIEAQLDKLIAMWSNHPAVAQQQPTELAILRGGRSQRRRQDGRAQ